MSVTVTTNHLDDNTYAAAEKWFIDDEGQLHIIGPKGNLASYASGVWAFVSLKTQDGRSGQREPVSVEFRTSAGEPDAVQKRADEVAARTTERIRAYPRLGY